jgi:hypothetical protein
MLLTEREVDKLVFVLNHLIEQHGYNANKDGFSYDDDLNIFMKDSEYETIDFENGLDFLIDRLGIIESQDMAEKLYDMSQDMDHADYEETREHDVNCLKLEIEKIKGSVLYQVLEAIT